MKLKQALREKTLQDPIELPFHAIPPRYTEGDLTHQGLRQEVQALCREHVIIKILGF